MALKKLAKWEMVLIAGIILIIPIIIAYQLTKADIEIDLNPTFSNGCNQLGTVCMYNMDSTAKIITLNEDDLSWRITGLCVDTAIEQYNRKVAISERDNSLITLEYPANPEECRDLVIFSKDDWERENKVVTVDVQVQCFTTPCNPVPTDFELNIFTLKGVARNQDTVNFIEQSYGG